MKPNVKPKYPKEREVVGSSKRRKPERPWKLEFKWKSKRMWKESRQFGRGNIYEDSWEYWWGKYIDLRHAAQALAKELRSEYCFRRMASMFNERYVRLRNVNTGEIRLVIMVDNKFVIEEPTTLQIPSVLTIQPLD